MEEILQSIRRIIAEDDKDGKKITTVEAKANGAKLQYGSAGVGSTTHLACALLNAATGITVTHVPYRGGGPAMADMIGGQVQYMCSNTPGALVSSRLLT